ncbi:MAG: TlpA disulfide reductase family protein [Rikenellaceae bacterium]
MTAKFLTMMTAVALLVGCSTSGFTVKGDIQNLADGMVYLNVLEGKQPVKIDSVASVDGAFTFEGSLPMAQMATIESNGRVINMFFLDNSEVLISGDANAPKKIAVTGSPANDLYNNMYSKADNVDEALKLIEANLDSPAAAYMLFRNLSYRLPVAKLEEYSNMFTDEVKESSYIKILNKRIESMKRSEVGQPYMEIELPTPNGEVVSLSSIVEAGNYVLVDFWASWCPPCRKENPNVVSAYNKYKDKGFTVYGVSLDKPSGKSDWEKAIADDKLTWTNVSDLKFWDCVPAGMYGVNSIPSNFLISPEGVIVGKNLREEELHNKLEELLNK